MRHGLQHTHTQTTSFFDLYSFRYNPLNVLSFTAHSIILGVRENQFPAVGEQVGV